MSGTGTLFVLVTGNIGVTQFNEFNVKFRANRSRNWLALADHKRVLADVSFKDAQFFPFRWAAYWRRLLL